MKVDLFASFVLLCGLVTLGCIIVGMRSCQGSYVHGSGRDCRAWLADCALHRALTECRIDARALGCTKVQP